MCGGPEVPYKPDSSDLLAIIHPVIHSPSSATSRAKSTSPFRGRLRLSNRTAEKTTSELTYDATTLVDIQGPLNVRIHRYATSNMMAAGYTSEDESSDTVMHSFIIDGVHSRPFSTSIRMDLGVGGDGVVGRTVSILDSEQRLLGEGIIGRI